MTADLDRARRHIGRLHGSGNYGEAANLSALLVDVARLRDIVLHVVSTPNHSTTSCPPLTRAMCPYHADIAALREGA